MNDLLASSQSILADFFGEALGPFRAVRWQTVVLLLFSFSVGMFFFAWVARISWRFRSDPLIATAKIRKDGHSWNGNLGVTVDDYLKFHSSQKVKGIRNILRDRKDAKTFYVISFVDADKRALVFEKELKLWPKQGSGTLQASTVQLDWDVLSRFRESNFYVDDDDFDKEISGAYDIYVRRAHWYDLRHWLLHPDRDVRLTVWVFLMTTFIPPIVSILFGL